MKLKLGIVVILISMLIGCKSETKDVSTVSQNGKVQKEFTGIDTSDHVYGSLDTLKIEKHLKSLASDAMEGRMPCTPGGKRACAYIANELKRMGIEYGNGKSYSQYVPLLDIEGFPSEFMQIKSPNGDYNLKRSDDFVIHSQRKVDRVNLTDSELVFCGFGVVAPELGWNDFEGVDLKGKTAVVLINDPDFGIETEEKTLFKGETMTYYGRWTYKYEEADRQGADGLLIIHETASAGYPWFVIQSSWSGPQQGLSGMDRSNDCGVKGFISLDVAKKMFADAGLNIGEEIRAARKKGYKAKSLNAKATVSIDNKYTECRSMNIVGIIKGAKYPDEYVVYTSHWDHLGIGQPVDGDSIYNGALDNASGCAALLGIAEKFATAETPPDRSVVFLFVTAEEQGLLGSEYYVERPIYPLNQTVCNINIDGVNPAGRMKDLTVTGLGHSQMDDYAALEAGKQDRYVMGEQEPEKGYFFRSDHFNFAKKGVPVLYAEGGYDHRIRGKDYAKDFKVSYVEKRYHAPADEYKNNDWDLNGFMEDAQLYYNVGHRISNSTHWPAWKKGSEFGRNKGE